MSEEDKLKEILSRRGYLLKYIETYPSSVDDMYEMKVWVEDNQGKSYDYRNIYVRDCQSPKQKAFKLLVDQLIESYYQTISI